MVFKVTGRDQIKAALEHLHEREILNGYEYCIIPVEVNTREGECTTTKRINALTCIANADNEFYLGPTSVDEIGEQIANAKGCAGPNSDYLFKLADEIRNLFPDYSDQHLFELQASVMQRRQQQPLLC
ncbi:unnamed protein product [Anisakis simplex]|uniref:Uncharacterized protein n=1 Tax=Anisakis simplex TaxID=6269 RepID=A0A3P6N7T0_ANISI|nr:unnamed protein product [Anisakis simplex]